MRIIFSKAAKGVVMQDKEYSSNKVFSSKMEILQRLKKQND